MGLDDDDELTHIDQAMRINDAATIELLARTADDPEAGGTVAPEADGTIAPATPADSVAGTVAAPSFPEGLDWLNTATPVDLESLRGKVVLLDFWTYGCINCIHIIPDLKRLEAEYPNELVVIGVHSAKFTNESQTANIREVVQRYELEHPVVNDENFDIWNAWGTQAWPTVAVIDPQRSFSGFALKALRGVAKQAFVVDLKADSVSSWVSQGGNSNELVGLVRDAARRGLKGAAVKLYVDELRDTLWIVDDEEDAALVVPRAAKLIPGYRMRWAG